MLKRIGSDYIDMRRILRIEKGDYDKKRKDYMVIFTSDGGVTIFPKDFYWKDVKKSLKDFISDGYNIRE